MVLPLILEDCALVAGQDGRADFAAQNSFSD
jgi:hypothetical protein